MIVLLVAFAAVIVVAGGGVMLWKLRGGSGDDVATDRLERYLAAPIQVQDAEPSEHASLQRARAVFQSTVAHWLEGSPSSDRLAEQLNRAELDIRASEWATIRLIATIVVAWLLWWRMGEAAVGLIVGGAIGYFGPGFFLRWRIGKRRQLFDNQLSEVVNQLAQALRAGQSPKAAFIYVSKDVPDPMGIEFRRIVHEMTLGQTLEQAIAGFVLRANSNEVFLLASAIEIHRLVGGNLAENLDKIAETVRERTRIRGEIRTVTAQARGSAWIISLLPIFLVAFLDVSHPDYFAPMVHSPIGIWALILSATSMAVGVYIIRRIVNIRI
jgi:tight adherence protein B